MICRVCHRPSRVVSTVWIKGKEKKRRYRKCDSCGNKFSTIEYIKQETLPDPVTQQSCKNCKILIERLDNIKNILYARELNKENL